MVAHRSLLVVSPFNRVKDKLSNCHAFLQSHEAYFGPYLHYLVLKEHFTVERKLILLNNLMLSLFSNLLPVELLFVLFKTLRIQGLSIPLRCVFVSVHGFEVVN